MTLTNDLPQHRVVCTLVISISSSVATALYWKQQSEPFELGSCCCLRKLNIFSSSPSLVGWRLRSPKYPRCCAEPSWALTNDRKKRSLIQKAFVPHFLACCWSVPQSVNRCSDVSSSVIQQLVPTKVFDWTRGIPWVLIWNTTAQGLLTLCITCLTGVLITDCRLLGYFVTNCTEKMDIFLDCLQRRMKRSKEQESKVAGPSVTYMYKVS